MDRGIPTEAVLAEMRQSDPPVQYLVGTPKGRLSRLERDLLDKPWREARPGVRVKLLAKGEEFYVLAHSADRSTKERGMRRRHLKWLMARLKQLKAMTLTGAALLMKLDAARQKAPAAWRLLDVRLAETGASFTYALNRDKLRQARRREGRYLLPLLPKAIPPICGPITFSSSPSKRRSRPSRATSPSARSSIRTSNASRRTSLSPSSPIAST